MEELLFSGPARILMQGKTVLKFRELQDQYVEYAVAGFTRSPILVRDHRPAGIKAMQAILDAGRREEFVEQFNTPADLRIYAQPEDRVRVDLFETDEYLPRFLLWVVIGWGKRIPDFDYRILKTEPINEDRIAFFSLCDRPALDGQPSPSA